MADETQDTGAASAAPVPVPHTFKFTILWLAHNGNGIGRERTECVMADSSHPYKRMARRTIVEQAAKKLADFDLGPGWSDREVYIVAGFRVVDGHE